MREEPAPLGLAERQEPDGKLESKRPQHDCDAGERACEARDERDEDVDRRRQVPIETSVEAEEGPLERYREQNA